ncbi:MAG: hypothetical protein AMXMBFR64_26210 [Myxococcales bacterium]
MKRWMFALAIMAGLGLTMGPGAEAKAPFTKATGLKCAQCHEDGKPKKEASDTPLYKVAKEHVAKGDCMECHKGKAKPDK